VDNTADHSGLQATSYENLEVGENNETILQTPQTLWNTSDFDIDDVLYIVFDIETTEFSCVHHSIIEIAYIMLGASFYNNYIQMSLTQKHMSNEKQFDS
jgi:DNA polymerase III alpha subunit (gram-positive type)